jgi:hypothetical protein
MAIPLSKKKRDDGQRERERLTSLVKKTRLYRYLLRVHPRVGDEGEGAAAGDVVEGDGLEEELGAVVVLDDDGSRDAQLRHLPVEGDAELDSPVVSDGRLVSHCSRLASAATRPRLPLSAHNAAHASDW